MKCIILAAGYATRLYPLTENFPKPLLKVGEKTILDWLIDDISPLTEEFIVISNHKFVDHFRTWAVKKPYKITVLDDGTTSNETRLGAVKDIQFAVETLISRNTGHPDQSIDTPFLDDCLVMAGDNVLDFSLHGFIKYAQSKNSSCVMCHEENNLARQQKTAIVTMDDNQKITSYEEKPEKPKGNHAVPPFYYYRAADLKRIPEALAAGCGYDAPGSFAAWLSGQTPVHAYIMPGKRYDIGDLMSYQEVQKIFSYYSRPIK